MNKICTLIFLCFVLSCESSGSNINSSENTFTIIGMELIVDNDLKSSVLKYIDYSEKLEYIRLFDLLSDKYLSEHFPNIINAEQYSAVMEDNSEIS